MGATKSQPRVSHLVVGKDHVWGQESDSQFGSGLEFITSRHFPKALCKSPVEMLVIMIADDNYKIETDRPHPGTESGKQWVL